MTILPADPNSPTSDQPSSRRRPTSAMWVIGFVVYCMVTLALGYVLGRYTTVPADVLTSPWAQAVLSSHMRPKAKCADVAYNLKNNKISGHEAIGSALCRLWSDACQGDISLPSNDANKMSFGMESTSIDTQMQ